MAGAASAGQLVLIDFTEAKLKPHRRAALAGVAGRVPATRVTKVSKRRWAQLVKEHPFVLSPHGHGLDCHRTWEVLLLGSFPVVASSSLDSLYEGLPVVIVERWDTLSAELLLRRMRQFEALDRAEVERRMLFAHWRRLIDSARQLGA